MVELIKNQPNQECLELKPAMGGALSDHTALVIEFCNKFK